MNFYPHHISDFNNSTRHLTRVERSVYRDAIELYYDTESVLTLDLDALARKLICTSDAEISALKAVLKEFFIETDGGYFHVRCDLEIAKYRANTSAKARAGIASAEARRNKATKAKQKTTRVEQSETRVHNHEPVTINHKPKGERGTRLPTDWEPSLADIEYCKTTRPDLVVDVVAADFRDYWTSKAGKDAVKLNWTATWQMWVRKQFAPSKLGSRAAEVKEWHETKAGVLGKAKELGIAPWVEIEEHWHEYKQRVMNAFKGGSGGFKTVDELYAMAQARKAA